MEEKYHDNMIDEEIMHRKPKAVHQCNECNKIFVSFKGFFTNKKNIIKIKFNNFFIVLK